MRYMKTTGDVRLDDRKLGNPWRAIASRLAPKRIYKPRRVPPTFQSCQKSGDGRSFTRDRSVIWRMSADSTRFWVGSETLTVAHCHIAIDLACSLT
jgi:hypothetical protein